MFVLSIWQPLIIVSLRQIINNILSCLSFWSKGICFNKLEKLNILKGGEEGGRGLGKQDEKNVSNLSIWIFI